MTDGQRTHIVLLDERRLEIMVSPKLYAGELLNIVASHVNIKEKEYFGLAFLDEGGHCTWLHLDHRVLDHEFPSKSSSSTPTLHFLVKYFVESIVHLKYSASVEAFFLQAKSLIFKGTIVVDSETAYQLAALVLQVQNGDFVDDETTKAHLKKVSVIPTTAWKEHPSVEYCEERVIYFYKSVTGQTRGEAIVNYVTIVESLPTYGVHYYQVKDKSGMPWWLGISYKGITQCDFQDKKSPRRVFLWKQLENLLFRDKKFSIEVREARRVIHTLSSFNLYEDAIEKPLEEFDPLADAICDPTTQVSVSRRTLGPGNVTVYVWFAENPSLTKAIWSMAIAQHQFHLEKKPHKKQITTLNQIASELCRSVQSLASTTSLSRSASLNSLPLVQVDTSSLDLNIAAKELLTTLKARRDSMAETLQQKIEELKSLCIQEAEITGQLPLDMPIQPGDTLPHIRRRVGTAFTLNDEILSKAKLPEEEMSKLELEYEIHRNIASASLQLVNESNSRKSLRKQRKVTYNQAQAKLKEIECNISTLKKQKKGHSRKADELSLDLNRVPDGFHSAPSSPSKLPRVQHHYHDYDSISTSSESGLSFKVPYRNRFESRLDINNSNLYNVANQRTSQVLDSLFNPPCLANDNLSLSSSSNQSLNLLTSCSKAPLYNNLKPCYPDWRNTSFSSDEIASVSTKDEVDCNLKAVSEFKRPLEKSRHWEPRPPPLIHHSKSEAKLANSDNNQFKSTSYHSLGSTSSSDLALKVQKFLEPLPPLSEMLNQKSDANLSGAILRYQSVNNFSNPASACSSASNKAKSKEWTESSLDSPILSRKAAAAPSHNPQNLNVVQPYWEETKPYETADFYKYSTKHRTAKKPSGEESWNEEQEKVKRATLV